MNFSFRGNAVIAIVLLCIFGLVLRLIPSILNGFWFDEAAYFFISRESSFLDLYKGAEPAHPFLWPYFTKIVGQINTPTLFLRLPSMLTSTLSIFLIYKISMLISNSKKLAYYHRETFTNQRGGV